MKNFKFNLVSHKKRRGSTLLLVVITAAVVALLGTAVITAVISANNVTTHNNNSQQAYFTARSAVSAVVAQLQNANSPLYAKVQSMSNNSSLNGSGSYSGMGYYTVNITKTVKGTLTTLAISGKGYYPNQSQGAASAAACTLSHDSSTDGTQGSGGSRANPLTDLMFVTDAAGSSISPSQCTGDIVFNGSLTLTQGASVTGNVYLSGGLDIDGGSSITQNAYVGGNLTMAAKYIKGDVICLGKTLSFSGGGNQVLGTLTYKGSVSCGWGTLSSFAASSKFDSNASFTMPTSNTADTSLPSAVSATTQNTSIKITQNGVLYNNINNNFNINQSGTVVSCDSAPSKNTTINVNTSGQDIYLLINNSISFSGWHFYVTGTNHLYIYLANSGTTLTLNGGEPVIRMNTSVYSSIFVIGGTGTSLVLDSGELQGDIYIPNGSVTMDGGPKNDGIQTGYSLVGSLAVKDASISANVPLDYCAEDLTGTPLASLVQSSSSSSQIWQTDWSAS